MKRYLRIELLLLIAQLMAIGVLSLVSRVWESEVRLIVGDLHTLPALSLQFFTHHTLIFGAPAMILVLLYGFCFYRYDRSAAGRRFVVVSLSLLIFMTCVTIVAREMAMQEPQWQSIRRNLQGIKDHGPS